jgi:large subunit ribosomal protein L21e
MFGKGFRLHGMAKPSMTLVTYKRGDVVDIKVDGSQHKGQPYKTFHGKTGIVFNVTKTSVGVQLMKKVKHRLVQKRFHAKVEHVRPSSSRKDFLERVIQNDLKRKEARAKGERYVAKRQPKGPKPACTVTVDAKNPPVMVMPKAFEYLI